ncbi:MAG TPA: NfeD family protein [Moraxellaceae bacterium]|nr:NfeD family protein [Moraxellaceae bacterium]
MEPVFQQPAAWWLGLGIVLLIVEMLTGTFFFLFLGAGALLVSLLVWAVGLGGLGQAIVFGISGVVAVGAWMKLRPNPDDSIEQRAGAKPLNNRLAQYVGREADLVEPLRAGEGRIRLDDTFWTVSGDVAHELPVGTRVRITAVDGMRLHVEPVQR